MIQFGLIKRKCVLFNKAKSTINEHIKNVFNEKELEINSTVRNFRIVQKEGNRNIERDIEFYNLDVIISVGYRVKSIEGTKFRIWATKVLKDYMLKGYALNEQKLMENKKIFLETLDNLNILVKDNDLINNSDILSLIKSFSNT
ncbi:RhuM family protein [Oceanivirga salmonicida]|uniref:RhuM family protein n=1 Tax=Oceanivirga salmonicida TaxID=1769291 RepID=UPI0018CC6B8C|nr:RhuM family protein [Oceanivirga salmonicida]